MTQFQDLHFHSHNAFVLCVRPDSSFWMNCDLQCSGAMLVEIRTPTGLMSRYIKDILRDGFISDFMYGKRNSMYLTAKERDFLYDIWVQLRKTCDWDAKYAPGADFTGHDITPVNGIGDFS